MRDTLHQYQNRQYLQLYQLLSLSPLSPLSKRKLTTSSDSHHPKHAINGYAIGSSCEDATNDNHESRDDNSSLAAHVVAR